MHLLGVALVTRAVIVRSIRRAATLCAIVCTVLCALTPAVLQAQTLTMLDVDTSAFPLMSAKFYAFDAVGRQVTRSAAELGLKENGVGRPITSVSCPSTRPPLDLSAVLTIDISMSMASGISAVSNIAMAKSAARAWVAAVPQGKSECAITAFDDANYFVQDFSTDKAKLDAAIAGLTPKGGTDYSMGLFNAPAGALQVSSRGKYVKVIVFLTDGMSDTPIDEAAVIAEAKRQACPIYVVTLGFHCPPALQRIAEQTGGKWFGNITSIAEAEATYRHVLFVAQSAGPCTITWEGTPCPSGERIVELTSPDVNDTIAYTLNESSSTKLVFTPGAVFFHPKAVASQYDSVITVTAANNAISVSDVTSSNPAYTIAPRTFALAEGQSIPLTVSYTPPDSGYTFTEFTFITDKCNAQYYASGGYAGKPSSISTLRVVAPNGGETLVAGSNTEIKWRGGPATDNYKLEYSTNTGTEWKLITNAATGLTYDWKVPDLPSPDCLVRIARLASGTSDGSEPLVNVSGGAVRWSPDGLRISTNAYTSLTIWNPFSGIPLYSMDSLPSHSMAEWSPDASQIAIYGPVEKAWICDIQSGSLRGIVGHLRDIHRIRWSPDGTKLATACLDGWGRIWNVSTATLERSLVGHALATFDIAWNPTGTKVVTVSMDEAGIIWNAITGALLTPQLSAHDEYVTMVEWSPAGSRIATSSLDRTVMIWNANTHALMRTLSDGTSGISAIRWSPDGTRLLAIASDQTVRVWNASSGVEESALRGHTKTITDATWSADGTRIGTTSQDGRAIVWDAVAGTIVRELIGHTVAWTIRFSPDGKLVATSGDGRTFIWALTIETPTLVDTSDRVFAIVSPSPDAVDVDMKRAVVNTSKDSVIAAFVLNKGTYPFGVDSIIITGTDASQFSLVSGFGPYTVAPAATHPLEIRFRPTTIGMKNASLIVYTSVGAHTKSLKGQGIAQTLEIVQSLIDFGQVLVGSSKMFTQIVTIRNNSPLPITITGIRLGGPNNTDFTSPAVGQPGFTLAAGGAEHLVDVQFNATSVGRTSSTLVYDFVGENSPATIALYAEGVTTAPQESGKATIRVGTGAAKAGDIVTISATLVADSNLVNSGATSISAQLRFDDALLQPQSPLLPGTTIGTERIVNVSISLLPDANGMLTSFQFLATSSVDSITVLALDNVSAVGGNVVVSVENGLFTLLPNDPLPNEMGTATLHVGSGMAKTGDIVNIPIMLVADSNLANTGATNFTGRLRYNATLLRPLSPMVLGPITGNDAVVDVTMPVTPDANGVLTTLQFRAALGNDSVSVLSLENMQAVGGSVRITTETGLYTLDGICRAGGPRLLNPNGLVDLSNISPNPILNGFTDITIETSETGPTSLVLSDVQGRLITTFFDGETIVGRRIVALDLSNVASGMYMLTLRTPTEAVTIRIEVAP